MTTATAEQEKTDTKLSQLEQLRKFTVVVADTGDFQSIKEFKPRDATTNPSLIYAATQKEQYFHLLDEVLAERKNSGLDMEDRIELYLGTSSEALSAAIKAHQHYIANETLATKWADQPLTGPCHQASVKLEGQTLTIMLRKVSS